MKKQIDKTSRAEENIACIQEIIPKYSVPRKKFCSLTKEEINKNAFTCTLPLDQKELQSESLEKENYQEKLSTAVHSPIRKKRARLKKFILITKASCQDMTYKVLNYWLKLKKSSCIVEWQILPVLARKHKKILENTWIRKEFSQIFFTIQENKSKCLKSFTVQSSFIEFFKDMPKLGILLDLDSFVAMCALESSIGGEKLKQSEFSSPIEREKIATTAAGADGKQQQNFLISCESYKDQEKPIEGTNSLTNREIKEISDSKHGAVIDNDKNSDQQDKTKEKVLPNLSLEEEKEKKKIQVSNIVSVRDGLNEVDLTGLKEIFNDPFYSSHSKKLAFYKKFGKTKNTSVEPLDPDEYIVCFSRVILPGSAVSIEKKHIKRLYQEVVEDEKWQKREEENKKYREEKGLLQMSFTVQYSPEEVAQKYPLDRSWPTSSRVEIARDTKYFMAMSTARLVDIEGASRICCVTIVDLNGELVHHSVFWPQKDPDFFSSEHHRITAAGIEIQDLFDAKERRITFESEKRSLFAVINHYKIIGMNPSKDLDELGILSLSDRDVINIEHCRQFNCKDFFNPLCTDGNYIKKSLQQLAKEFLGQDIPSKCDTITQAKAIMALYRINDPKNWEMARQLWFA